MNKKIFSLFFLLNIVISYGQLGVGTETPSSTLEVVQNQNNYFEDILKLQNASNETAFSVNHNGDVFFRKSLYLNQSPGIEGSVIIANQENDGRAEWANADNTVLHKYIAVAYNSMRNNIQMSTPLNANTFIPIDFTSTSVTYITSSEIGTWNTPTVYKIKKSGIYEVNFIVKAASTTTDTSQKGVAMIKMGSKQFLFRGSYSKNDIDFIGKSTSYLEEGSEITVSASVPKTWKYNSSLININYSPKTTL